MSHFALSTGSNQGASLKLVRQAQEGPKDMAADRAEEAVIGAEIARHSLTRMSRDIVSALVTNVGGACWIVQGTLRRCGERLTVASSAATLARQAGQSLFTAGTAGLVCFVGALACDFHRMQVTVNAAEPGVPQTATTAVVVPFPAYSARPARPRQRGGVGGTERRRS